MFFSLNRKISNFSTEILKFTALKWPYISCTFFRNYLSLGISPFLIHNEIPMLNLNGLYKNAAFEKRYTWSLVGGPTKEFGRQITVRQNSSAASMPTRSVNQDSIMSSFVSDLNAMPHNILKEFDEHGGTYEKSFRSNFGRTNIRKICPCNEHPLKLPHFYIVKLGYAGAYLFLLFLLQNINKHYHMPVCTTLSFGLMMFKFVLRSYTSNAVTPNALQLNQGPVVKNVVSLLRCR